jgi:mRNA interferase HicA
MKRQALLRHLRRYGCYLKREGGSHSLWINPVNGSVETVPRHNEIPDKLARRIFKGLGIPDHHKEE